MIARLVRNKYAMLIIGLVILGIGLIPSDGTVSCGGNTMQPGDTCHHTTDGISSGTNTYEQEKASQEHSNVAIVIVGGLLTLGAAGWIGYSLTGGRKKQAASGTEAVQNAVVSGS